jgi:hypothetical protein
MAACIKRALALGITLKVRIGYYSLTVKLKRYLGQTWHRYSSVATFNEVISSSVLTKDLGFRETKLLL